MKHLCEVILLFSMVFYCCATPLFAESLEGKIIKRVVVSRNRTSMFVLSPKILLKEGLPFREADVEETKKNLYDMKLFKTVDIKSVYNQDLQGVDVNIEAKDGWYIMPLPFLGGGGGGNRVSLMLFERNFFKAAESVSIFASYNSDGEMGYAGLNALDYSLRFGLFKRQFTERLYADGWYNSTSFSRSSRDEVDVQRFGEVADSYTKDIRGGSCSAGYRVTRKLRMSLAFETNEVGYRDPTVSVPNDSGKQNAVTLSVQGSGGFARGQEGDFSESFGAIFGLGLADVGEKIKPLAEMKKSFGYDASVSQGGKFAGSDFTYTMLSAGVSGTLEFTQRHTLSLRVRSRHGIDLPFSQSVNTGRSLALIGNYARENRGDTGLGSSLSFACLLRKTKRGIWVVEPFVEEGMVWRSAQNYNQHGAGANVYYRFWRFPLPLGFGYTYSIKDKDSQFSFSLGGRF